MPAPLAPQYEHLSQAQRARIRQDMAKLLRADPRPNATSTQRLERALGQQARKYGVKRDTIARIMYASRPLQPSKPDAIGYGVQDNSGLELNSLLDTMQTYIDGIVGGLLSATGLKPN